MSSPQTQPVTSGAQLRLLAVVVCLLAAGWWLRIASLDPMSRLLHHDEAWYALNAVDLIEHPRLITFFPENYGRESGWMYVLAGWISVVGRDIAGLRLIAALVGVLTLAAVYRLGRELFDPWVGVFALAALAGLLWHIMVSQQAVRANFSILMVALAALAWARALAPGQSTRGWLIAGVATGALAYTYFAAFGVLAFLVLAAVGIAVLDRTARRGVLIALLTAGCIAAPQAFFAISHLEVFTSRSASVASGDPASLAVNALAWVNAFWLQGDADLHYNVSGRPVLDPIALAPFLTGLGFALRRVVRASGSETRARWVAIALLGGLFVTLAPSLVSSGAPNYARACLAVVPIALLLGLGMRTIGAALSRLWPWSRAWKGWPILLIASMVVGGRSAFVQEWLPEATQGVFFEAPLVSAFRHAAELPQDQPVYLSPFTRAHPVIQYLTPLAAGRPLAAFDSHQCLALSDRPATYFSIAAFEDLATALQPWADVTEVQTTELPAAARWLDARLRPEFAARLAQPPDAEFVGGMRAWLLARSTEAPGAGERILLTLALRTQTPTTAPLGLFVHVYGDPSPYAGGRIWAQNDAPVCDSDPSTRWRADETIVQSIELTLPSDLAAGRYDLVFGLYTYPDITRLAVAAPDPTLPHVVLASWTVSQ